MISRRAPRILELYRPQPREIFGQPALLVLDLLVMGLLLDLFPILIRRVGRQNLPASCAVESAMVVMSSTSRGDPCCFVRFTILGNCWSRARPCSRR